MIDYCGSIGTEWVPDLFPQSCKIHDYCYYVGNFTQENCDYQFFFDMLEERGLLLLPIALIYFVFVFLLGKKAYQRNKKSVK